MIIIMENKSLILLFIEYLRLCLQIQDIVIYLRRRLRNRTIEDCKSFRFFKIFRPYIFSFLCYNLTERKLYVL